MFFFRSKWLTEMVNIYIGKTYIFYKVLLLLLLLIKSLQMAERVPIIGIRLLIPGFYWIETLSNNTLSILRKSLHFGECIFFEDKDANVGEVKCSLLIHFTVVLNFNGSFHNTPKVLVDSTVKRNSSKGVELYDHFLR